MEGGHAVDRHAAGNAQIGHADLPVPDDRHVADPVLVAAVESGDLLLPPAGDLADDLPDTGQQGLHQLLGPALQSLGQYRVVGVGNGVGCDVPCGVPIQARVVHEDAHQLGDDQGGVGVVDLDDVLLVEVGQGAVGLDVLADDGLDGGGDEEILLAQAQALALIVVVLGVENLGDDLGHGLFLVGLQILALAEQAHVNGRGALGVPQAQDVGVLGAVTCHGHVAGHSQHPGVVLVDHVHPAAVPEFTELSAEMDLLHLIRAGDQPGVALILPVVGQLQLLSIHDLLLEDAQLIADGIAVGGDLQGGQAVQTAGRQTAQAAVAQSRVRLHVKNMGGLEAQILNGLTHGLDNAQVVGVLHQTAAHEELQGHIVDLPELLLSNLGAGLYSVGAHPVPQYHGAGLHHIGFGGLLLGAAEVQAQLVNNGLLHGVLGHFFHIGVSSFLLD